VPVAAAGWWCPRSRAHRPASQPPRRLPAGPANSATIGVQTDTVKQLVGSGVFAAANDRARWSTTSSATGVMRAELREEGSRRSQVRRKVGSGHVQRWCLARRDGRGEPWRGPHAATAANPEIRSHTGWTEWSPRVHSRRSRSRPYRPTTLLATMAVLFTGQEPSCVVVLAGIAAASGSRPYRGRTWEAGAEPGKTCRA
jgi:hypothetical protein